MWMIQQDTALTIVSLPDPKQNGWFRFQIWWYHDDEKLNDIKATSDYEELQWELSDDLFY